MTKEPTDATLIAEVENWLACVADCLPQSISAASLGVRDKAPFKALAVREALIWRMEELTRGALALVKAGDLAAAIMLIRGVVECTALMARLAQIVFERSSFTVETLDDTLTRMWMGWKTQPEDLPVAFNILTMVDHLDKRIPGVRRTYDRLSEFAHPNWSGVAGLFSQNDVEHFVVNFGRLGDKQDQISSYALIAFSASVQVFDLDYNNLADLMPEWLAELEPLG